MFDQDPAAPTIIFIANNALHFVAVEPGSSLSVQIVLDASSWSSGSVDAVAHSDALGVCVLLASPADSPTHHSVGNDVMRDVVVVDDGGGHDARSVIALVRADTGAVLCRYALGVHERPVCAMFLPAGSQCTLAVGVSALAHTEKGKGGAAGTASRTPEGRLLVFEWEHGRGLTLLASHATGGAVNAMCTLGDDTIVVGADKRVKVYRVVRSACDEDEEEEEEEEEPYSRNHSGKKKSSRDGINRCHQQHACGHNASRNGTIPIRHAHCCSVPWLRVFSLHAMLKRRENSSKSENGVTQWMHA